MACGVEGGAEFSTAFGPRRRQPRSAQGGGSGRRRWTGAGRVSVRVVAVLRGGGRGRSGRGPTARGVAWAGSRVGRGRARGRGGAAARSAGALGSRRGGRRR